MLLSPVVSWNVKQSGSRRKKHRNGSHKSPENSSRVTSVQTRCILETSHAFFKTSLADSGYASLACGWSRRPPRRQRWRLICWCPKMAISWGEISDILYFHGDIVSYRYNLMIYYITNYFGFLWNRLPKNPIVKLSHFTQTHIEK